MTDPEVEQVLREAVNKLVPTFEAFRESLSAALAPLRTAVQNMPEELVLAIEIECCHRTAKDRIPDIASGEGATGLGLKRRIGEIEMEVVRRIGELAEELEIGSDWFDLAADAVDGMSEDGVSGLALESGHLDSILPESVVHDVMGC